MFILLSVRPLFSCSADSQQLVSLGVNSLLSEHLFSAAGDVMSPCTSRLLIKKPYFTSQGNLNGDSGPYKIYTDTGYFSQKSFHFFSARKYNYKADIMRKTQTLFLMHLLPCLFNTQGGVFCRLRSSLHKIVFY